MSIFLLKIQGRSSYYDLGCGCLHDDPIGYVKEKNGICADLFGAEALLNDLEYLADENKPVIIFGTHKDERYIHYTEAGMV